MHAKLKNKIQLLFKKKKRIFKALASLLDNSGYWPKNLLCGTAHVRGDTGDECGLVKVASPGIWLTSDGDFSSLLDGIFYKPINLNSIFFLTETNHGTGTTDMKTCYHRPICIPHTQKEEKLFILLY
jgi:hypothetical protein